MSREEAIEKIKLDPINKEDIKQEFQFVANKLNISVQELEELFKGQNKSFRDYKSHYPIINFFTKILQLLRIEKRLIQ